MASFLRDQMARRRDALAIAYPGGEHSYGELLARIDAWDAELAAQQVAPGSIVSLEGEYGIETIAAFLALLDRGCTIVPLSTDSQVHADGFLALAEVERRLIAGQTPALQATGRAASHTHYRTLRERRAPGLVLFSSGSTGTHKAAVHDLGRLLHKFETPRHCYRTLVFLLLDHIGGVNTLLYTLSNGGAVVVPQERSPATVAAAIARHRVELLPTSPTFLNLLLLSGETERHDLSSLKLITYGTEPMPESTLARLAQAFPGARLLQTYGLTELGILRSQSRGNSLWVRVGGEGYQTKVVEGRLFIRAESAMLGYLNAPAPFDAFGYFDTGDRVEVDGDWLRILGRETEIVNVGGSKVYPAEVESVLLQLEGVLDAVVRGEANAITGQTVVASIRLVREEPLPAFKARMRLFCRDRLEPYKVPTRISLTTEALHSARYKRMRRGGGGSGE